MTTIGNKILSDELLIKKKSLISQPGRIDGKIKFKTYSVKITVEDIAEPNDDLKKHFGDSRLYKVSLTYNNSRFNRIEYSPITTLDTIARELYKYAIHIDAAPTDERTITDIMQEAFEGRIVEDVDICESKP